MLDFCVVIPARHASSRLPAKALLDIAGKPMVVRVAERAAASGAAEVWVATDHPEILEVVQAAGFKAMLTRPDHASGTDRVAEVARTLGWPDSRIVVNLQGDEPMMPPELLRDVAQRLAADPEQAMATLCHPITDAAEMFDPNVVKVVVSRAFGALYFSRAPIPFDRDGFARGQDTLSPDLPVFRHLGLYAYRCAFLRQFTSLSHPALERHEALEQLRALWHGYSIGVVVTRTAPPAGVDTAQDLERVLRLFQP